MVSIPFASLARSSRDHRAPGQRRDLSRLEHRLWQFLLRQTSVLNVKGQFTLFGAAARYVGSMDGLMGKSCGFGAEMKIRLDEVAVH